MKYRTAMLFGLLLLALPAAAATVQVDETRPAEPDGEVSVELLAGTLEIVGWDREEVRVTGTIDDEYEELEIDAERGGISIELDVRDGSHPRGLDRGARLKIQLPARSELEVEAVSAEITIEDLEGTVDIEAISGNVLCRGSMTEIEIECVSGEVEVDTRAEVKSVDIETVSGSVEFRGALGRGAQLDVESVNGSVTLRLPASTSAEFEISTFNGSIKNDFGQEPKKTSKFLPAQELSFTLGSGDASVTVEAFNGTVRLIRE